MPPPERESDRSGYQHRIFNRVRSKCKQVWSNLNQLGSKILEGYKKLPRLFQMGVIYLAVGLVAIAIFCWQVWSLRATYPYISENEPDKAMPPPNSESLEITTGEHLAKNDAFLPETEGVQNQELTSPLSEGEETLEVGEKEGSITPSTAGSCDGVWPVSGELYYGYHDPVTQNINPSCTSYRFSRGLAIKACPGSEVKAIWRGRVTRISFQGYPYGQAATVQHDNGLEVYYGALQEILVEEGGYIQQGGELGYLAGGLQADPPYLYLEMSKDKEPVDPMQYLP